MVYNNSIRKVGKVMSNKVIENNNMNVSKEFIRCLEIEHDIMLLENQIKNLTQERDKLVKELECLKEQTKTT
jgi:arsenate reductase-like glutaredoxin family protein